jgi:hypothetical protein
MDFSPKRMTEQEVFTVDFATLGTLAAGETILSAAWSNSVIRGVDANAGAMIQGSATVIGTKVSQLIKAGLIDVFYAPVCTAVTSLGQVLVLPEYGHGLLRITP